MVHGSGSHCARRAPYARATYAPCLLSLPLTVLTPCTGTTVASLLLSVLAHGNVLHLLLNVDAMLALGARLEPALGSVQFAWATVLLGATAQATYVVVAGALAMAGATAGPWHSCLLGLSGVLFGLVVIDAGLDAGDGSSAPPTRWLLGWLRVPTVWYPWALLLLTALVFPQSSLLGHLGGMLAAYALVHASDRWMMSPATVRAIEARLPAALASRVRPHPGAAPAWHGPAVIAAVAATGRAVAASATALARTLAPAHAPTPPATAGSQPAAPTTAGPDAARFPGAGAKLGTGPLAV
jgi:membrane associated rhomboid family serine protease